MKIFVIHYKKLINRKNHILEQFKKHNINDYEFIEIDREDLDKQDISMFKENYSKSQIAISLSHFYAYKEIRDKYDHGLIFEDDVMIATDFYKRMLFGLNTVPSDWEIYLLGLICLKCDVKSDYISVNRFWGTHGYLLKKESAAKLVSNFDKLIDKQIDADISLLIKQNKIKVYAINPIIVAQQNAFLSDIQVPVENTIDAFNEEFNQKQIRKFKAKYKPTKVIKN
jgi:GR25 family glycosyltransferase involved in LPS biosynthesis